MSWDFLANEIKHTHQFIRKDIKIIFDDTSFREFYNDFHKFFFEKKLSKNAYNIFEKIINNINPISEGEREYIKSAIKRTFDKKDEDDIKGLIGEHLLPFYYTKKVSNVFYEHGPKGRSSKEPGIDYIIFLKDDTSSFNYNFIVWEIKTTTNNVSSRVSEINRFFSVDGSFDENIDSTIKEIQDLNENISDDSFKTFLANINQHIIKNSSCFNIGGCVISSNANNTNSTFQSFENVRPALEKEQRIVKIIVFEKLSDLISSLKGNPWKRL